MNNQLLWCPWGVICDYSVGWKGATHDSRAAATIFKKIQSIEHNPGRLGAVVDTAYRGACCSGKNADGTLNGDAPVQRPLESEMIEGYLAAYFEAISKFNTTMRQHNEWGNNGEHVLYGCTL
jgi:hypothetical protein